MESRAWYLFTKKLTGEATDAECRELNHILSLQPHLHEELQALEAFWDSRPANPGSQESDFEKLVGKMHRQGIPFDLPVQKSPAPRPAKIFRFKKTAIAVLASLAAAAVVGIIIWFKTEVSKVPEPAVAMDESHQVSTRPGSRSKILLPDGTQVWLNADSKLTYGENYGVTTRDVSLSGEAYFDVVSNKNVPFYIHTSRIRIKVTGTAFNLRAYPNEKRSETSLIRGKVEITLNDSPDKTYYLKPKEKFVVSDNGGIRQLPAGAVAVTDKHSLPEKPAQLAVLEKLVIAENESYPVETAWVNNKLAFSDESFRDVANKMERWYGMQIVFASSDLEAIHFTGRFDKESVYQALDAMKYTAGFKYEINGDLIIISKSIK